MSGVTFRIEQQSDKKVVLYLQAITPRMIAAIHKALKIWIYAGANISATKYFAASQSIAKGARNTGSLLISRTGTLRRSIIASVDSGMTPSAPGPETTMIQAVWGAATPYARIQEYGGSAGRGHAAQIPPRPYLAPALNDSRPGLISAIQTAVAEALAVK
jgi:phage gpG-like protein